MSAVITTTSTDVNTDNFNLEDLEFDFLGDGNSQYNEKREGAIFSGNTNFNIGSSGGGGKFGRLFGSSEPSSASITYAPVLNTGLDQKTTAALLDILGDNAAEETAQPVAISIGGDLGAPVSVGSGSTLPAWAIPAALILIIAFLIWK